MRRQGRVAATQFLHATLNGIFGIFPVGIFVFVIIFFNKPCNVFIDAGGNFPSSEEGRRHRILFSLHRKAVRRHLRREL